MGIHIMPDRDNSGKTISHTSAFASKEENGKSLFKRVHGISIDAVVGDNILKLTVPYPSAKIKTIELIGGEVGDTCNFFVLDTAEGTLSTIPNYVLNQFGFNVAVGPSYYEQKSEYDADLFLGLQLSCTYNSLTAKKIGINFILDELK